MLCCSFAARAEPAPAVAPAPAAPEAREAAPARGAQQALPLRVRLDRDTIRAAIAGLPVERDPNPRRHEADTISATPLETFAKDFENARLPDCLHSEGLRNQTTLFLSGVLALPFIPIAMLRGVCR